MIPRLRSIVEQRTLGMHDYVLKIRILIFRAFDETVEVVYIGFLMLSIVEFYGSGAYHGLERVFCIR